MNYFNQEFKLLIVKSLTIALFVAMCGNNCLYIHFILQHKAISTIYAATQAGNLKQMRHNPRIKTSGQQIHVGFVSYNFNNHPVSISSHMLMFQYLYL